MPRCNRHAQWAALYHANDLLAFRLQGFFPLSSARSILPGDHLDVTCLFNSTGETKAVGAGHTHNDEMCNLYMMVYGKLPFFMYCVDRSPWMQVGGAG